MSELDVGYLQQWIGRQEQAEAVLTEEILQAYRATLKPHLHEREGFAPAGLHWCLAPTPAQADMSQLGTDGHPRTGGFLPPVPLPRRMWAGGAVETFADLPIGEVVQRISTITDVQVKQGRSGILCFVTVSHELSCAGQLLIRERQDIVYREPDSGSAAAARVLQPIMAGERQWTIETPPTLLFRYSALTFNAHRIHYDLPYATREEGYAGLVVQGPLQASILFNLASIELGHTPRNFSYRGQSPLIAGDAFHAALKREADGSLSCWTQDASGSVNMKAIAQ